jgi:predicted regulator of Ras-like GTPase activity (Roadblock/LC7/MglB family)
MIPIPRLLVILLTTFATLAGVGMLFAIAVGSGSSGALVPVYLLIELLLYIVLTMFTNSRLSMASISVLAVSMALTRLIACMVGGAVAGAMDLEGRSGGLFLAAYAGTPASVFLQMLVLAVAMPHILEACAPELVSPELRDRLGSAAPAQVAPTTRPGGSSLDTIPSGGFIQVFSYDELTGVVRKTQGLEGFLVYSSEGLIVWRDLPMRIDADALMARVRSLGHRLADAIETEGLTAARRVMVETKDHLLFVTELNPNFGVILIYNSQVSIAECSQRVGVVAKTVREFLQWKYPGLPVTPSLQSELKIELM